MAKKTTKKVMPSKWYYYFRIGFTEGVDAFAKTIYFYVYATNKKSAVDKAYKEYNKNFKSISAVCLFRGKDLIK
jgi:hypothetical protein|tara:strand:- start:1517 stop:1738 length:222 start_codon:yes stop_codon:yes gene_type:complete